MYLESFNFLCTHFWNSTQMLGSRATVTISVSMGLNGQVAKWVSHRPANLQCDFSSAALALTICRNRHGWEKVVRTAKLYTFVYLFPTLLAVLLVKLYCWITMSEVDLIYFFISNGLR